MRLKGVQLGQDHKGPALPRCYSRDTGEQPRRRDLLGLKEPGKMEAETLYNTPRMTENNAVGGGGNRKDGNQSLGLLLVASGTVNRP